MWCHGYTTLKVHMIPAIVLTSFFFQGFEHGAVQKFLPGFAFLGYVTMDFIYQETTVTYVLFELCMPR